MASLGNPRTWIPYINTKNCSQELCTFYSPQCCYTLHSPPPQPLQYHHHYSNPNFIPLIIAFIGIFAIVILLIRYYTIMSKYYYSLRENNNNNNHNNDMQNLHVSSSCTTTSRGLDESVIKSIMICKYQKGNDGFVGLNDCSVCVSEFEDDESVRVLPKCGHVFHLPCIDEWLKSHSTCPLCRANVFNFNASSESLVIEMVL